MDTIVVQNLGFFLLGAAGSAFVAYLTTRSKHVAKIDAISEKIDTIATQETLLQQAKEIGKISAVDLKLNEVLEQHRSTTTAIEAAKVDVLTAKIEHVVAQQERITLATEQIKSDIDIATWQKKEHLALLRVKIEQLYEASEEYFSLHCYYIYDLETPKEQVDRFYAAQSKISMLLNLYFRDFKDANKVHLAHYTAYQELIDLFRNYTANGIAPDTQVFELTGQKVVKSHSDLKVFLSSTLKELIK
ncbi:TPA: hypothetical protein NJ233_000711 [Vibrio parahaemolyticus]|nr:hypothetical protein [Vibrio parahaemolyticus]HCG6692827.1 hypothetical protein [Vibrio parahaemolyticus]